MIRPISSSLYGRLVAAVPGGPLVAVIGVLSAAIMFVLMATTPRPWLAVIVPILLGLAIVGARYPLVLYLGVVFMVPQDAWRVLSGELGFLTISKFLGIYAIVVVALRLISQPQESNRIKSSMWLIVAFFFLSLVVSTVGSPWPIGGVNELRMLAQSAVLAVLTVYFSFEKGFWKTLMITIVASTTFSAVVAIATSVLHLGRFSQADAGGTVRAVGTAIDPNLFAATVLCSLPYLTWFALKTRRWIVRIGLMGLIALNSYAIMITYSRAVILVLIIVLIAIGVEFAKRFKLKYLGFVLLVGLPLIAGGGITVWNSSIGKRMQTLSVPAADKSLLRRASYVKVGLAAFQQRPFLGWGPASFQKLFARSIYARAFSGGSTNPLTYFRPAHNTYLQILVDGGAVGLALFLLMPAVSLIVLYRLRKDEDTGLFARMVAYSLLSFLLSITFLTMHLHKYLWLHIGIAAALAMQTNRNTPAQKRIS